MIVEADTIESQYLTLLSAWTGTQGALNLVACNGDLGEGARITFPATAGTTYYFMVTVHPASGPLRGLQFHVNQLLPPGNDDFADATPITSLPFADQLDLAAATTQPSEPSPSCVGLQNTAWYSFTPTATQSVSARIPETYGAGLGVYTGTVADQPDRGWLLAVLVLAAAGVPGAGEHHLLLPGRRLVLRGVRAAHFAPGSHTEPGGRVLPSRPAIPRSSTRSSSRTPPPTRQAGGSPRRRGALVTGPPPREVVRPISTPRTATTPSS